MTTLQRLVLAIAAGLVPSIAASQRPLPTGPMPTRALPSAPRVMARLVGPPPAALQISFANPGVLLVWQGVAAPAGYRVYRATDPAVPGTELTTAAIAEAKFLDLTAAPGVVYYYTVSADYADARLGSTQPTLFGVPTATRSGGLVKPLIGSAPATLPARPPAGLAASTTPVSVTLTWNAGLGVQFYEVSRVAPNGQATLLTQPNTPLVTTTLTDRGVQPGIAYRYDVSAVGGRGDRATSQKSVTLPGPVNPTGLASTVQLTNVRAQLTPTLNVLSTAYGTVNLSWQPVPGAASYRIAGPNIPQYRSVTGTGTSVIQVPPGKATYTVVADFINGAGQRFGLDNAPASLVVQVGSEPVQGLSVSQAGGGLFNWYDQNGATGFHLMIADRPEGPYVESTDAIGPTWGYHRPPEAVPGRSYWYKVISTFPTAPAAVTETPLLVCKTGQQNLTGLEVVSNHAGAVKIRWHPICFAWYHVYTPTTSQIIPYADWLKSEYTDPATLSGKSYLYNVCSQRQEPYVSTAVVTDKCAQITVTVP